MNITKEIEDLQKYKESLKKIYNKISDFEWTIISNAFINGYRAGYDQRMQDYQKEIDTQENIYDYESEK